MQPSAVALTGAPLRFRPSTWGIGIGVAALVLALPVLTVFSFVLHPAGDVWAHLAETVLADYVTNSLVLMLGVAVGTTTIGVSTAWLTACCRFTGQRFFAWALLLPLAIPAYIIAYTYTGMLDFAGPVQTLLRSALGWSRDDYWFPEIRSLGGAVTMLSLVLYPYVYLLARAAFLDQSVSIIDASRTLGYGPWASFLLISLPIARPAIIAGLSLALMETLADYGTVQYFGVSTFTTGIFRTWFGLGDSAAAAQLSALLMSFALALMALERWSRHRARYHHVGQRSQPLVLRPLSGWRHAVAFGLCALVLLAGFLLPAAQLALWAFATAARTVDAAFLRMLVNTLALAGGASALALAIALFMAYGQRLRLSPLVAAGVRLAGMGYAVPGVVIAVGVMIPFSWLDNTVDAWLRATFGVSSGLLLSGTLVALVFAYLVRFLAVSLQTVEAGLARIRPTMDDTARSLGYRPLEVLARIHVPVMKGSLLTGLLLVFVDVMKELPATLVLRPFNFNTLAVRAWELASDERLADSATAALAIVAAGVGPVIVLSRSIGRRLSAASER